ncbi:hypothetical protein BCR39DRAFT_32784 [Naematelia encephala]|uniref:RRM domain-containing protein n=1 Tax=Naematelia encephala TaxID=71784 RepID=A0A1Y2BMG1_9TREE|nr:hypothetical protein BCR39DRAFT_32784 [Naematelia encephala]
MSFNYTNPYAPPSQAPPAAFSGLPGSVNSYQVLLSGIPLDVRDADFQDLMTRIGIVDFEVTPLYDTSGKFLGKAIMTVRTGDEAELIRREYSGQTFDADVKLTVHHILSPTQPLPAPSVTPMQRLVPASAKAAATRPAAPPTGPASKRPNARAGPSTNAATSLKPGKKDDGKPDGLKLLARLQPQVKDKQKQAALLAKQKANLKAKTPGAALLSRMTHSSPVTSKVTAKINASAKAPLNASNKLARAKAKANQGQGQGQGQGTQVVKPVIPAKPTNGGAAPAGGKAKDKPRHKTQAELDDEIAAFQRSRRFAAE